MKLRQILAIFLVICLLTPMTAVFAAEETADRRAVIGADLSDEQIESVYKTFGIKRGDIKELRITNADERRYLEGHVDSSKIGTRSISCVYIELQKDGKGTDVQTSNINWCTAKMYISALATAGITDAKIIVTAPFEVSGTAALAGIYQAYEDMSGKEIDAVAKEVGTEELTVTAKLAEQLGGYDITELVNELKLILDDVRNMTDEELRQEILKLAEQFNVKLTDSQIDQLIKLCRSLEKLNPEQLKEKVEGIQNSLNKLAEAKEKISGISAKLADIFKSIGDFFKRLFGGAKTA
ncbi:MAG: DUF1002 domain-containing protein [Ruminococcaceae bacterium]|nr:DUF1002 domain-containing protein [Oscillospiraceae bacterium]